MEKLRKEIQDDIDYLVDEIDVLEKEIDELRHLSAIIRYETTHKCTDIESLVIAYNQIAYKDGKRLAYKDQLYTYRKMLNLE